MAAGKDSVAWDTGCATGDQDLAVTWYDRTAESDTSEGSDPSALDGDWVALGAVQRADVTAPVADAHWTGRADTTGLRTTTLNIGPVTFQTSDPGLIDPSSQFYGTRKWTLYSFGRQKAFNFPFCTSGPVYATHVALHASRPPVVRTELEDFGFSTVVKQGGPPRPVRAFVTYPDGREGVPEITGETPVRVQLDGNADELGDLQWEDGSSAPAVVPFSAVDGPDSEIFYKPQESKNHEVAVDPVRAGITIEPVPDSVKVQKEPDRFTIGGYDLSLSIEADTLEWGETTTVDVDPVYPDGDTVRVGQVGGNVFLHELLWFGVRQKAASSKSGLQKEANGDEGPEGTSAPRDFGVLDCPDRKASAQVVLPDTSGSDEFEYFESGCDEFERFLMLNLPQAMASRDTIGLVTDSTTLRPRPGEPVRVTVQARSFFDGIYGSGAEDQVIVVSSQPDTVLLGETRYYQAIQKDGALELEALDDPSNASANRVEDVTWTVSRKTGDRLGVYYDTEYYTEIEQVEGAPVGAPAKPQELPSGLIQVIGRFWTPQTTYGVTLSASGNGKTGEKEIAVTRPDLLGKGSIEGTGGYFPPREVGNINGELFDVDSLIIAYAGRYGIPPQFIKGQAAVESAEFLPSYRYEPLTTQFAVDGAREDGERDWTENPFFVTETSMGSGQGVPSPQNVYPEAYPQSPQTVWEFLTSHSDLEGETNSNPEYVDLENGRLDFGPYSSAAVVYDSISTSIQKKNIGSPEDQLQKLTVEATNSYLREEWRGPDRFEEGLGGLQNMVAQTRTASSYGMLQIMYNSAIDSEEVPDPYPVTNTNKPERLNVHDVSFPIYMKLQIEQLRTVLGVEEGGELPDSDWRNVNWRYGSLKTLEQVFFEMYNLWNPEKGNYEQEVFGYSQDFLPVEKE